MTDTKAKIIALLDNMSEEQLARVLKNISPEYTMPESAKGMEIGERGAAYGLTANDLISKMNTKLSSGERNKFFEYMRDTECRERIHQRILASNAEYERTKKSYSIDEVTERMIANIRQKANV